MNSSANNAASSVGLSGSVQTVSPRGSTSPKSRRRWRGVASAICASRPVVHQALSISAALAVDPVTSLPNNGMKLPMAIVSELPDLLSLALLGWGFQADRLRALAGYAWC